MIDFLRCIAEELVAIIKSKRANTRLSIDIPGGSVSFQVSEMVEALAFVNAPDDSLIASAIEESTQAESAVESSSSFLPPVDNHCRSRVSKNRSPRSYKNLKKL
jgi:hypothetical protein